MVLINLLSSAKSLMTWFTMSGISLMYITNSSERLVVHFVKPFAKSVVDALADPIRCFQGVVYCLLVEEKAVLLVNKDIVAEEVLG
jgi:hypothetical protein